MKHLISKILKEVEEEKLTSLQENLLGYISTVGILDTIKMVGDINNFNKILPGYFDKNSHKIDLINELVNNIDPYNDIYFNNIIGRDFYLDSDDVYDSGDYDSGDGHTFEEYIISVGDGSVRVNTYEFDEDGNMFDDSAGYYFLPLKKLSDDLLNLVFESLVSYYLL